MSDGAFNDRARAAIYEIGSGRCIGCGRTDLSAQHRRARRMGGTSDVTIGHPANGVPLCGGAMAGTVGCHAWAERNPVDARLLGWALEPGEPALGTPFWSRIWGWRAWGQDAGDDHFVYVVYVDEDDLDRPEERRAALRRFQAARPELVAVTKPSR